MGFAGSKLNPIKNRDITWFYLFLPVLVIYLSLLTDYINEKPVMGTVEVIQPKLFNPLIHKNAKMEIIATGMEWSEGPLWIDDGGLGYLIYGDTILNRLFKWEEGKGMFTVGKTLLGQKTGCSANLTYCSEMYEPGSNGLLRLPPTDIAPTDLDILVCQHGERAISIFRENGTRQVRGEIDHRALQLLV
jgi:gluconolactonase